MKRSIILSVSLFLISWCHAQDDYHLGLQQLLQEDYNLPVGEWIIADTEAQINSTDITFGCQKSIEAVAGQPFSQKMILDVTNPGNNPWDASRNNRNTIALNDGEVSLIMFWLRTSSGTGRVSVFAENTTTFAKEVFFDTEINTEWRQYYVPFESTANYAVNQLTFGFHLAHQVQTIEVGGYTAIKYPSSVDVANLPSVLNNDLYDGHEEDAPWRAVAAANIEELRKANLTIEAKNQNGEPLNEGDFDVKMIRHEYSFGSAVVSSLFAGNNAQNVIYEDKIKNLDGKGHGFNEVVFENDLKWPAWEQEWISSNEEVIHAVEWLRAMDIDVRGHTLLWPGSENLPGDINFNINDLNYIKNRIFEHIETMLTEPGLAGNIEDWDVINEIVTNRTLEMVFVEDEDYATGRELYAEVFEKVKEVDPNVKLYLNDFITLTLRNTPGDVQYDNWKKYIQEILDAGAPLEGLGFQAHIGGAPNGIPEVLSTLDDFYDAFGLRAKITEFDLPPIVDEDLAEKYLGDFLTAIFGHASTDGFLFWNFWDGSTWQNPGANLFRQDWTLSKPGEKFIDLVFKQWWTDELISLSAGSTDLRGFKGKYEISYECEGELIRDTIWLSENYTHEIVCESISVDVVQIEMTKGTRIFPNPTTALFTLEVPTAWLGAQLEITNAQGVLIATQQLQSTSQELQLPSAGVYILTGEKDGERFMQKVVRHN